MPPSSFAFTCMPGGDDCCSVKQTTRRTQEETAGFGASGHDLQAVTFSLQGGLNRCRYQWRCSRPGYTALPELFCGKMRNAARYSVRIWPYRGGDPAFRLGRRRGRLIAVNHERWQAVSGRIERAGRQRFGPTPSNAFRIPLADCLQPRTAEPRFFDKLRLSLTLH